MTRDDESVSLVVVSDDQGRSVLPAFTSEDALRRWRPEGSPYIGLAGSVVVGLLADSEWDRMVIDGGDVTTEFVVTRAKARAMLGIEERVLEMGSTMLLSAPSVPLSDEIRDELFRECFQCGLVSEAHFFQWAADHGDSPPHLAIGLCVTGPVDRATITRIVRTVGNAVTPNSRSDASVDLMIIDAGLLDNVRALGPPVFRRASGPPPVTRRGSCDPGVRSSSFRPDGADG